VTHIFTIAVSDLWMNPRWKGEWCHHTVWSYKVWFAQWPARMWQASITVSYPTIEMHGFALCPFITAPLPSPKEISNTHDCLVCLHIAVWRMKLI
jgi:hypothetical protein